MAISRETQNQIAKEDFAAIENDEISITPVHLELTDKPGLEELRAWDVDGLLRNGLA